MNRQPPPTSPWKGEGSNRWCPLLFLALGAAVIALILLFELEPSRPATTPRLTEGLLLAICAATAVIAAAWWALGRRAPRRPGIALLAALALAAGLLYLYGQRGLARAHYAKWHDGFHYILGAKYFGEVGYLGFYDCAAAAHVEDRPARARRSWKVRDLATYKLIDAPVAIARCDRRRFSAARWAEFRRDVALFHRHKSVPSLLRDHGYNGSPFHTFFASRLADLAPLDYASVTALAVIDVAAIAAMLALVALAFGPRLGLLFAILYFANFSDRYYFIGGSMMRYAWMATLAGGVAALKLGRYRTAGALMTTSALLNVFPILFLAGVGLRALWSLARARFIAHHHRRFIAAAALTGVVGLGVGAAHGHGVDNYTEFFSYIGGHSAKLTSSRTGLVYTVLYRGERERGAQAVGYREKARQVPAATPFLIAIGALLIGGALVLAVRLDDVAATALVGFTLFFTLFSTVEYYYAVTPILLLAFHDRWRPAGGALIAGAFALMAAVLLLWRRTQFLGLCNNTAMSAALLSLLATTLVALAAEVGRLRLGGASLAAAIAAAAASGPLVVAASSWAFSD